MSDKGPKHTTALITGGGRRIGAAIVRGLHREGMNVVLHYRHSRREAEHLTRQLNGLRPDSARCLQADLADISALPRLIDTAAACWNGLDLLVNNASAFYPTDALMTTESQWDDLLTSNLKAPFFLAQAAAPLLKKSRGSIVNIVDIHAERPMKGYGVYSIAKAGLVAMTRALAKEFGPEIRVNGIAPGAILWPEREISPAEREAILSRIILERLGSPEDVATAVVYLTMSADYTTGQILTVDGGRSLFS